MPEEKTNTNHALPHVETLVAETRAVFQPLYQEPLGDDDCREIIMHVFGLFEVLYGNRVRTVQIQAAQVEDGTTALKMT